MDGMDDFVLPSYLLNPKMVGHEGICVWLARRLDKNPFISQDVIKLIQRAKVGPAVVFCNTFIVDLVARVLN